MDQQGPPPTTPSNYSGTMDQQGPPPATPPNYSGTMDQQGPPPATPPNCSETVGGENPANSNTPHGGAQPAIENDNEDTYGPTSKHMVCPHCHAEIDTSVQYKAGCATWGFAIPLLILAGYIGCCLAPFCIDGCKDVHHTCPNCKKKLGIFLRNGRSKITQCCPRCCTKI